MKYISQVIEPEEDIGELNRLRGKWFLEEMSFELARMGGAVEYNLYVEMNVRHVDGVL